MKVSRAVACGVAAVALAVTRALLRIRPAACVRWASEQPSPDRAVFADVNRGAVDAIASAVAAVGPRTGASCLEQGLALVMLLSIVRTPSRLVLGVRRDNGILAAHAWVEARGRIVLGAGRDGEFAPLPAPSTLSYRR